jgi:hypothetical protein
VTDRPDWLTDDGLAAMDRMDRIVEADRARHFNRIKAHAEYLAKQLTTHLPPEMRAAGMRFEWAADEGKEQP